MSCRFFLPLASLLAVHSAVAAPKVLPVLNQPLTDRSLTVGDGSVSVPLNTVFGAEAIDDQVVRFTSQFAADDLPVVLDMALFSNRTPLTRQNFLKYVSDGDYVNSFIHRSVPGFVIQGGGFKVDSAIIQVPTDPPIQNEFGISNTFGTISMAKTGDSPNSATSQWFVSTGENSENLDNQNGGFTVFGRVTRGTIENAQIFNDTWTFPVYDKTFSLGSVFNSLPLFNTHVPVSGVKLNELILFTQVGLVALPAGQAGESTQLNYSVVSNSAATVAQSSIDPSGNLVLTAISGESGPTVITIRATDSVGNTVDDTIRVTVRESFTEWKQRFFTSLQQGDAGVSGPLADPDGDGLTNLELFMHGLEPGFHQNPVKFEPQSSGVPRFVFPLHLYTTGASFVLEQSSDLGITDPWKTIAHQQDTLSTSGKISSVAIRATSGAATYPSFYRIRFRQD